MFERKSLQGRQQNILEKIQLFHYKKNVGTSGGHGIPMAVKEMAEKGRVEV